MEDKRKFESKEAEAVFWNDPKEQIKIAEKSQTQNYAFFPKAVGTLVAVLMGIMVLLFLVAIILKITLYIWSML